MAKVMSDCTWTDAVVELQAWIQLAHFSLLSNDHDLVMLCTQKAKGLEEAATKKVNLNKLTICDYSVVQEMFSIIFCTQGQSIFQSSAGNRNLLNAALNAFELSACYAEKAGNNRLAMTAARHFWNACLPIMHLPSERQLLRDSIVKILKAVNCTSQKEHLYNYCIYCAGIGNPEEDLTLRTAMYALLFFTYADNNDWEAGLNVLDEAIWQMPRTKHRLFLFKHRAIVKARLGQNTMMDMQKLRNETEDYISYMWSRLADCSKETADKLSCYQNAIGSLKVSLASGGVLVKELMKNQSAPSPATPAATPKSKQKGKKSKEPPTPVVKEKPKRKGPLDVLPATPEEWAGYDCPDEIREVFKHDGNVSTINNKTITKPMQSLYYLDQLVKELQLLSLIHLTLPVLQFAEVIAHEVMGSKSRSDLYHLRIAQVSTDLGLNMHAAYHEKIVGTIFIYDEEQIKKASLQLQLFLHKLPEKNINPHSLEKIMAACDRLSQSSKELIQCGHKKEGVDAIVEQAMALRKLASKTDNEEFKHHYLLESYRLMNHAVMVQEEVFCNTVNIFNLQETRNLSLPVTRKLAKIKLMLVDLTIDMLQILFNEEKMQAFADEQKGPVRKMVEEYVRNTPDCTSVEQEEIKSKLNDDEPEIEADCQQQEVKQYSSKASKLKNERLFAQQTLAQATEVLAQTLSLSINNKFTDVITMSSLDLLECFQQFDHVSSCQYLALYQSCRVSMMMSEVLNIATSDTSSSQLAALMNLLNQLHGTRDARANTLFLTVQQKLTEISKAYANLMINPQHLNHLNDLPPNFRILILQHSEDRSVLYGAFFDKAKANEKLRGPPLTGPLMHTRVARTSVNPDTFSKLLAEVRQYKQNVMKLLLKKEFQKSYNLEQTYEVLNEDPSDFNHVVKLMKDYLRPILSQFDFSTDLFSDGASFMAGATVDTEESIIVLADKLLMELPLEALKIIDDDGLSTISRDFSLQLLWNRMQREEPDVVDPYNEVKEPDSVNPVNKMKQILETYSPQFTPQWQGIMGNEHVPSHAELEQLLNKSSAFVFYGTERFLANLMPSRLVAMNVADLLKLGHTTGQTVQAMQKQSALLGTSDNSGSNNQGLAGNTANVNTQNSAEAESENEGESEVATLQRRCTFLEGNKQAYERETYEKIRKQEKLIKQLEQERQDIVLNLEGVRGHRNEKHKEKIEEALNSLIEKGDDIDTKIMHEAKKHARFNKEIKELEAKLDKERKVLAEKKDPVNKIRKLRNHDAQASGKYNTFISTNSKLREEIETLRGEKEKFQQLYKKIQKELEKIRKECVKVTQEANEAHRIREEAQAKILRVAEQTTNDLDQYTTELSEIQRELKHSGRVERFLQEKTKHREPDAEFLAAKKKRESKKQEQKIENKITLNKYEEAVERINEIIEKSAKKMYIKKHRRSRLDSKYIVEGTSEDDRRRLWDIDGCLPGLERCLGFPQGSMAIGVGCSQGVLQLGLLSPYGQRIRHTQKYSRNSLINHLEHFWVDYKRGQQPPLNGQSREEEDEA
ncbi:CFA46 protein, partial [Polypterus senegalus]